MPEQNEKPAARPWAKYALLFVIGGALALFIQRSGFAVRDSADEEYMPKTADAFALTNEMTRQTQQMHYPSFSELYAWPADRVGLQLESTGRLHMVDGSEDWLPRDVIDSGAAAVLYKYHITCCPGHSVPLVVPLTALPGELPQIEQDGWARVVGKFEVLGSATAEAQPTETPSSQTRPAIAASLIEAAEEPAEPVERLYPERELQAACAGILPPANYPPGRP